MSHLSSLDPDRVVEAAVQRKTLIDRIVREAFVEGVHYGSPDGGQMKATLLKPGADDAIQLLELQPDFTVMQKDGDGINFPSISAVFTCKLTTPDGVVVAEGCAGANSWEKKWRWRKAEIECPKCGVAAVIKGKAEYGGGWLCWAKKNGCGAKFTDNEAFSTDDKKENPDPWDLQNSIVKYGKKRAQIDAVLQLGFSAHFTQDVESPQKGGFKDFFDKSDPPRESAPEATQEDDPKPEGLAGEVRRLCKEIASESGEPWEDVLALASSYTVNGKPRCTTPATLAGTSDKSLRITRDKLKKRASTARLAANAPDDSPF